MEDTGKEDVSSDFEEQDNGGADLCEGMGQSIGTHSSVVWGKKNKDSRSVINYFFPSQ